MLLFALLLALERVTLNGIWRSIVVASLAPEFILLPGIARDNISRINLLATHLSLKSATNGQEYYLDSDNTPDAPKMPSLNVHKQFRIVPSSESLVEPEVIRSGSTLRCSV